MAHLGGVMEKIPTIFNRDWSGHRGVIDEPVIPDLAALVESGRVVATEKLDGTNVRLIVREHTLVRVEARRNPDKSQKAAGITEPWYRDTDPDGGTDRYVVEAAEQTDLANVPDGEWSGEAIGPKIQGNPLGLEAHTVVLFSLGRAPVLDAPTGFEELRAWLPEQRSALNPDRPIEGVVWHVQHALGTSTPVGKIKMKDFK